MMAGKHDMRFNRWTGLVAGFLGAFYLSLIAFSGINSYNINHSLEQNRTQRAVSRSLDERVPSRIPPQAQPEKYSKSSYESGNDINYTKI